MSSNKCSRCEQTVYPVEGLRCLDKIWHKGCFKCQECNMTLNLKNYKGFEKKPYCNAHCPQAKATTVVDTPEQRRLAENTRIQSQAKYHEDFEKSKGKITAIADDPETVRLKQTSKIISNVAYHGELERKKQMEEKRKTSGSDEDFVVGLNALSISGKSPNNNYSKQTSNNNNHTSGKHHTNALSNQSSVGKYPEVPVQHQQSTQQQPPQHHLHKQHQGQHQKDMLPSKQKQQSHQQLQQSPHQQQHQQLIYTQDSHNNHQHKIHQPNGQQTHVLAQHSHPVQNSQAAKLQMMQQQHLHQQQQQLMMRQNQMMLQQQQHQQQQSQQHQQHRHSMDAAVMMNNQPISKQYSSPQIMKQHQQSIMNVQQHPNTKYMSLNEPTGYHHHHHQASPTHLMGGQMMSPAHLANGHRLPMMNGPPPQHVLHPQQMVHHMNGGPNKQQQQPMICIPQQAVNQRPVMHPSQAHHHHPQQTQHIRPVMMQQQVPRRVFRAMYDYVANDVDEVSFFENDILIDCVNVDGNWLMGKVARSGQTGMLPANYVAEFSSH